MVRDVRDYAPPPATPADLVEYAVIYANAMGMVYVSVVRDGLREKIPVMPVIAMGKPQAGLNQLGNAEALRAERI